MSHLTTQPDFAPIYARLKALPSFPARDVQDTDHVYQRGTREGFADNAGN